MSLPSNTGPQRVTPSAEDEVGEQAARAARASALGRAADASSPVEMFLAATGGWFGIVEALAPAMVFLVTYVFTLDVWPAVAAAVVLAAVFIGLRLLRRQSVASALGGLVAVVLSGVLALRSGQGTDFFLIGFWTNAAYLLAFVISMLVRWPLIGVVVGLITGQGMTWRKHRREFWLMQLITAVWCGLFALRLAVQLPMYLAGNTQGLGIARMLMGPPLFGVIAVFTVLFVRGVYRPQVSGSSQRG